MAGQTRSQTGTADNDVTTTATGGTTSGEPGGAAITGTAGRQSSAGSGLPLPLPGLPVHVDPKKVLWWGGLAALATIGVIEWPVAAVVGAGSWVAEQWARQDVRRDTHQQT